VSKRSTWVAWSLLGAYTAGIGATVVLAVANGRFERDWQGLIAQTLAFAAYSVDLPPGGGHRGYAAVVDGSGLMVTCCCSHSMGGR
jgi:hypothetical protein